MDIEDKIKKLLRLSKGAGTPEEAATAAARAQELIDKYNIDRAILDKKENAVEEPIKEFTINYGKKYSTWKAELAYTLSKHNNLFQFRRGAQSIIIGRESDFNSFLYMYNFLLKEIDNIYKKLSSGLGLGKEYGQSFRLGVVDTLKRRLQESRAEYRKKLMEQSDEAHREELSTALIKVDAQYSLAKQYADEKFKLKYTSARNYRGSGYDDGRSAGNFINLGNANRSINSGQKALGKGK